jgi:glycosyltransferase involved in cell wall biosynthesis
VEVHTQLLGDGPENSRLQALSRSLGIESQVQFHGRVSLQGVRDAYRLAHVGVLASRTEGFPKALAEAMSGGAVPVASDVGINAQMLGEGRGRLFQFGDAAGLADRLAELAGAPAALRSMALAGREYTRTRTLEAFWDLQNDILTNRLGVPALQPFAEEASS